MASGNSRVVVVTGASRGLGREIAIRFGSAGERVAINYLFNERDALDVAETVRSRGGEAFVHQADVRNPSDVNVLIRTVESKWGRLDVLINNAGIMRDGLAVRLSEEDWDSVLDTNLKGPFLVIRAASNLMMKQKSGHIISIASISGLKGREGQANYSAAKAGLIALTKTAAIELGKFDIKVNVVLPGYLGTDMGRAVSNLFQQRILSENVLGRMNDAVEVAEFIYRLSLMKNVSGQIFNLDSRIL